MSLTGGLIPVGGERSSSTGRGNGTKKSSGFDDLDDLLDAPVKKKTTNKSSHSHSHSLSHSSKGKKTKNKNSLRKNYNSDENQKKICLLF